MGSLDDLLVDYSLPVEGIQDRSRGGFYFPKKAVVCGAASSVFANIMLTGIPFYYRLAKPMGNAPYPLWDNIVENGTFGFFTGFAAGIFHDIKTRKRQGNVFGFSEIAAAAFGALFFVFEKVYVVDPLVRGSSLPKDLLENVTNASAAFTAYAAATGMYAASEILNPKNFYVASCSLFSRAAEFLGDYGAAISWQKGLTEMPSRYRANNVLRLGNLQLKGGRFGDAAESYANVFQVEQSSSDIFYFPFKAADFLYSGVIRGKEWLQGVLIRRERGEKEKISAKLGIAASCFMEGEYRKADAAFREAIMEEFSAPLPHFVYSVFLLKCGMEKEAGREQLAASLLSEEMKRIPGTRNVVYEQEMGL